MFIKFKKNLKEMTEAQDVEVIFFLGGSVNFGIDKS